MSIPNFLLHNISLITFCFAAFDCYEDHPATNTNEQHQQKNPCRSVAQRKWPRPEPFFVLEVPCSIVLLATEMKSLAQEEREELLKTAAEMKPEQGLALKAGLGLPWNKLRLLRCALYVYVCVCVCCACVCVHMYDETAGDFSKCI